MMALVPPLIPGQIALKQILQYKLKERRPNPKDEKRTTNNQYKNIGMQKDKTSNLYFYLFYSLF